VVGINVVKVDCIVLNANPIEVNELKIEVKLASPEPNVSHKLSIAAFALTMAEVKRATSLACEAHAGVF
jgi:hypothetical protein